MFFNSVISGIALSFKFSNILNPTERLVESRILLVHIWISWFVLVDIGILIYTVSYWIPICTVTHTWKQDNIAFTLWKMDLSDDITTRIRKKESIFYHQFQASFIHLYNICTLLTFQWKHTPIRLFRIMSIPTTFRRFLVLTSEEIGRRLPVFMLYYCDNVSIS
jgi:hypothetical protein